jgi:aspartyl-tRNA(Asn)/glutamyl-tRNA(Gln) amidotransferase subunit C
LVAVKITDETVRQLCDLARLHLEPAEAERMRDDLEKILDYVEKLSELDTTGIPPTSHVVEMPTPTREDEPEGILPVEEALRNAPSASGNAFVVPKVIE